MNCREQLVSGLKTFFADNGEQLPFNHKQNLIFWLWLILMSLAGCLSAIALDFFVPALSFIKYKALIIPVLFLAITVKPMALMVIKHKSISQGTNE